jgi:hypothetical protein
MSSRIEGWIIDTIQLSFLWRNHRIPNYFESVSVRHIYGIHGNANFARAITSSHSVMCFALFSGTCGVGVTRYAHRDEA